MADGPDDNVGNAAAAASTPLLTSSDSVTVQIVPPKAQDGRNSNAATAPVTAATAAIGVNMDEAEADLAIRLTGAYKSYGREQPVLLGLDMAVPRGKIYGLLGPSGCGKTTLLKCIVGKLGLDAGEVLVFGEPPGSGGTGVPGARVGYMPQELALFGEFNIEETLTYFRRIFGE